MPLFVGLQILVRHLYLQTCTVWGKPRFSNNWPTAQSTYTTMYPTCSFYGHNTVQILSEHNNAQEALSG